MTYGRLLVTEFYPPSWRGLWSWVNKVLPTELEGTVELGKQGFTHRAGGDCGVG